MISCWYVNTSKSSPRKETKNKSSPSTIIPDAMSTTWDLVLFMFLSYDPIIQYAELSAEISVNLSVQIIERFCPKDVWIIWRSACVLSCFSCVWLCATLWTAAHQAPLSMQVSRQEYWSGLQYNDNYCYCGSKRNKRGVEVIVYHPEKSGSEFSCAKDEKSPAIL